MTQVTEHVETRGVPFEPIAHEQAMTLPLIKHADEMARTGCGSHGPAPAASHPQCAFYLIRNVPIPSGCSACTATSATTARRGPRRVQSRRW